jgi:glucan phosphoethanolaminetransferase (alkaline phosphatase superfamily)
MFEKIFNKLRNKKLFKELVILLTSYFVFILGTVGWYYFDNCEQAGSCAFLGICGLITFFVYLIIVNYKTIQSIFAPSDNNDSPSFKALSIQLTLSILVFFLYFYGCGYLLILFDIGLNPESLLTVLYIWILLFLLCCCISLFILFIAKTIKCLFLRPANNSTTS